MKEALVVVAGACLALLVACERPPMETEQQGYRGVGMESVKNSRLVGPVAAANRVPDPMPPAQPGTPPASEIFQNLEVLGHLESGEFTRVMAAITSWVSPQQGCNYCHAGGNFAEEGPYTKHVARRMIEMTLEINRDWKEHVGSTGVTCYTCHRGMPVPANYWHAPADGGSSTGIVGNKAGQNAPSGQVGLASLPSDPFTPYLLGPLNSRVQSSEALPASNRHSIKETEWTYGFMMHISTSLGVNCTYCHNSRAFSPWEASSPPRVTAWQGIQMARHLNQSYMEPLTDVFPDHRKGPEGDVFKVNCATCHQGVAKPLMGVSMLQDYPELASQSQPVTVSEILARVETERPTADGLANGPAGGLD